MGRALMTQEYDVRRPFFDGISPYECPLALKWNHSVISEPDFCSEWEAAHRASELALQCSSSTFDLHIAPGRIKKKLEGVASVSFDPWVDVRIGNDDHSEFFQVTVHADALNSRVKPWSNRRLHGASVVSRECYDYGRDVAVDVSRLFNSFAQFQPCEHSAACSDPLFLCEAVLIPGVQSIDFPDPFSQAFVQQVTGKLVQTQPAHPLGDSSHGVDETKDFVNPSCTKVVEPLREAVVLSPPCGDGVFDVDVSLPCLSPDPGPQCVLLDHLTSGLVSLLHPGSSVSGSQSQININDRSIRLPSDAIGTPEKGHVTCPTTDGSANEGMANAPDSSQGTPEHATGRASSPIRLPPFAQQMMVNLPMEFLTNPVRIVQGFVVRAWYLHHINIPLSLQARQIMLTGPPHLWRAQILTTWADFIIPAEDLTLDLVSPNPPRNWHETHILFDLILAQGLYSGRFSGLVTISPTITEPNLRMYAVAVSLEPVISGQDIVTGADIQPLCNQFDCLVFFSRDQLYIDFNRVHHMQHGHGFVVYLSRRPSAEPTPLVSTPTVSGIDPFPEPQIDQDAVMDQQQDNTVDPFATDPTVAVAGDENDLRRVTLYRLHRQTKAVWIRWRRFSHLLQDILEATTISPADMVAIHLLLAKPVGETMNELSVIIQQQQDIEPGSSDCLVLIDAVFHQQGSMAHMYAPSAVDRKVVRVPQQLTRHGVLQSARVANYCDSVGQACLVALNHHLWPLQEAGPKSVLSGSYIRVQVPPANVHGAETCRAASLVEDFFDSHPPSFAQVYPALPHHTDVNARSKCSDRSNPSEAMHDSARTCRYAIPRKCHVDEQHVADAPAFETSIPTQAAPVFPNAPDWHTFDQEMQAYFDELSVVDIPEEGPVMHVTTWFVHHDHAPVCLVGRLIRLSNRPFEWFAQLCNPWMHMLRPFENLAFHVVRPTPVSDIPGMRMLHIILEQGIQQSRMTALFSAIFQGMHGDITHRRAQSIPTVLSQEIIIRILDIQSLCRARRCVAWSGRTPFQRVQTDPVYSGIGVCLTVDAFRNRFALVDEDGFSLPHSASSTAVPPRMSFRVDDASLFPTADQARSSTDLTVNEHVPSNLVPELKIIWQHYLMTSLQGPYRFYVETWFCDHDRFPRTNRGREVLLSPDHSTWKDTILAKWHDMIDPTAEVFLYVVSPQPLGGPTEVLAHVLLAQHQHRGFVSALITTIAPGDDIWDPPRVALKLPAVVDKGLLIQESGLFMFCPPFMPFNTCRASRGDQEISQDTLMPASSGHGFVCTANAEATALIQEVFGSSVDHDVQRMFEILGRVITQLTTTVVKALAQSTQELRNSGIGVDPPFMSCPHVSNSPGSDHALDATDSPLVSQFCLTHNLPAGEVPDFPAEISKGVHQHDCLVPPLGSTPIPNVDTNEPIDTGDAPHTTDPVDLEASSGDAFLASQLQRQIAIDPLLPQPVQSQDRCPIRPAASWDKVTLCLDACIAVPATYREDGFVGAEIHLSLSGRLAAISCSSSGSIGALS